MGSTTIHLGPLLGLVLLALAAGAATVAALGRLGLARAVLTASARATIQLGLVSLVIVAVLRSGWATAGFIAMMVLVAAFTAGRRSSATRGRTLAIVAIAAGVTPVLALVLGTGLVPLQPIAVVPIAGILIGGAMTAAGLAGRRALDELHARLGEFEAYLALGFLPVTARREICRAPAAQALLPALDQTRTVGLVTLPGAFVGVLLGGASPLQAGTTQLLVLIGLLGVETIATLVVLELVSRDWLAR